MSKNKETLETYKKIARQYAETNKENETVQLQREVFHSYLKKGTIYDFGCGTGRDVNAFSKLGYQVKGFDGSDAMLSVAKKMYPNNHFEKLDMLEPHWGIKQKADGIWSCASLLHFEKEDFISVFKKMLGFLKDGGIFYFSLKTKPTMFTEVVDGRFFQYYTKDWLDEFLKKQDNVELIHYEENEGSDRFLSYFLKKKVV